MDILGDFHGFSMAHRFIDGLPFLKMGGFSMANCEKSSDGKPRDPRDQWCAMFRTSKNNKVETERLENG